MRQLDVSTYIEEVTRIDDQQLTAFDARQVLESALYRVDRPYGGLACEGFAELEQEIVASSEGGYIDRRSVGCGGCAGGARRDGG